MLGSARGGTGRVLQRVVGAALGTNIGSAEALFFFLRRLQTFLITKRGWFGWRFRMILWRLMLALLVDL